MGKKFFQLINILSFSVLLLTIFQISISNVYAVDSQLLELPRTGTPAYMQTNVRKTANVSPKVTSSVPLEISELPRTGIPLIAWGLSALVPVGFGLLKKGRNNSSQNDELSANSIWTKRQFDK